VADVVAAVVGGWTWNRTFVASPRDPEVPAPARAGRESGLSIRRAARQALVRYLNAIRGNDKGTVCA
jgi:hypothetical protein